MKDYCVMCGEDVTDLGTQVCVNCQSAIHKDTSPGRCEGLFVQKKNHFKRGCVKKGKWEHGEFRCQDCGELIALAYKIGEKTRIYTLPGYTKYRIPNNNGSVLGEIEFKEFNDIAKDWSSLLAMEDSLSDEGNDEVR